MLARTLLTVLAVALPAGCAAPPAAAPEPGGPTDPHAAEAPLPPRSRTLALDGPALPPLAKDQPTADMKPEMEDMHEGARHAPPATQAGEAAALSAPRWTPTTSAAPATAPGGPRRQGDGPKGHGHRHGGTEQ